MIKDLIEPLLVSVTGHWPFVSMSLSPHQDPAHSRCSGAGQQMKARLQQPGPINTVSVLEKSKGQWARYAHEQWHGDRVPWWDKHRL